VYNFPKQCTRLQKFLEHKRHDGAVVKQDKCKHRYVLHLL
jgi:hypothetical protein